MEGTYLEAGVDWFSATLKPSDPDYQEWRGKGLELVELSAQHGNLRRFGRLLGYEGVSAGSVFVGERTDGSHIRAKGRWAVPAFARCWNENVHLSRLDIQVTKRFEGNLDYIGRNARKQATTANLLLPSTRRRKIHAHDDDEGGYTLYIGARTSNQLGRIYNKSAQSDDEHYVNTWRWEVELHNEQATLMGRYLYHLPGGLRPDRLAGVVWRWFTERGVECPWTKAEEALALPITQVPETDIERKLGWLEAQVRPTVRLLRDILGRERIELALGLSDTDGPIEPVSPKEGV